MALRILRNFFKKDRSCPKCGNKMEILLPKKKFEDPSVYKCCNCRCTFTFTAGGTSMLKANRRMLPSWSKQENIISLRSGEIQISRTIFSCFEYEVVFPQSAFRASRTCNFAINRHPEDGPGLDVVTITYTLKPFQTGLFQIIENIHLGGILKESCIHFFLVE